MIPRFARGCDLTDYKQAAWGSLAGSGCKDGSFLAQTPTLCALGNTVCSYASDGLFIAARVTNIAPLGAVSSGLGVCASGFELIASTYQAYQLNKSRNKLSKCVKMLDTALKSSCKYMWSPELQSLYDLVKWLKSKYSHRLVRTSLKILHTSVQIAIGVGATVAGVLILAGVGGTTMGIGAAVLGGLGAGLAFTYLAGSATYQLLSYANSADRYTNYKNCIRQNLHWGLISQQVYNYELGLFEATKGVNRVTHALGHTMGDYMHARIAATVIDMKRVEKQNPHQFEADARLKFYKLVIDIVGSVMDYKSKYADYSTQSERLVNIQKLANG